MSHCCGVSDRLSAPPLRLTHLYLYIKKKTTCGSCVFTTHTILDWMFLVHRCEKCPQVSGWHRCCFVACQGPIGLQLSQSDELYKHWLHVCVPSYPCSLNWVLEAFFFTLTHVMLPWIATPGIKPSESLSTPEGIQLWVRLCVKSLFFCLLQNKWKSIAAVVSIIHWGVPIQHLRLGGLMTGTRTKNKIMFKVHFCLLSDDTRKWRVSKHASFTEENKQVLTGLFLMHSFMYIYFYLYL